MASGFFALFDDIAILMDDVVLMSKLATKKTAGILADDLAVNAEKASGFVSDRELPILWKITKGSLLNKVIILPVVFLLSAYLPVAITPILLLGGLYLGYEGAEKIYEYLFHKKSSNKKDTKKSKLEKTEIKENEIAKYEKEKIKSAIVVDFILSVEIVIITLSTVVDRPLNIQIIVVSIIALLATVFVYGLVALLVRMDDLGYNLIAKSENKGSILEKIGTALVTMLPFIVRSLGVIGTIAMILVAGGIFVHNIDSIHHFVQTLPLPSLLSEFIVGLLVGFVCLVVVKTIVKIIGKKKES